MEPVVPLHQAGSSTNFKWEMCVGAEEMQVIKHPEGAPPGLHISTLTCQVSSCETSAPTVHRGEDTRLQHVTTACIWLRNAFQVGERNDFSVVFSVKGLIIFVYMSVKSLPVTTFKIVGLV